LFCGLVAVGVATGVLAGVLGVGGGMLLVPFLVLAVGMSQHEAEGTSLLVILPTALAGSLALRRREIGDLPIGLGVGVLGAAGGVAGALLAVSLRGDVLRLIFAALVAVAAVRLLVEARAQNEGRGSAGKMRPP
jgi:uncharacterized membrane protein YfcA